MNIYDFEAVRNEGKIQKLEEYRGKCLLVVNTASQCGFTPQYDGLQGLYLKYADKGLEILAFPCNQFGGQEPGSDEDISQFCTVGHSISFPIFSKIKVNGDGEHPLFSYLKTASPGLMGSERIKWNFTKFLISQDGTEIKRFAPATKPEKIEADIRKFLGLN